MPPNEPTFIFFPSFSKLPQNARAVASSMQSFETVLLLIALGRHPHAVITCAGAIESAIKAKSASLGIDEDASLYNAIEAARQKTPDLAAFPGKLLNNFRKARNNFVHSGFSPMDDGKSVGLLLEVGFPFLDQCYRYLHSFDLVDLLPQPVVDYLRIGASVLQRAKEINSHDWTYSLKSLGHWIRWNLKERFTSNWEMRHLTEADETGGNFEQKLRERKELENNFNPSWVFDCPLCGSIGDAVCELDNDELHSRNIVPTRMACVHCGFVVEEEEPFVTEALLKQEVEPVKNQILREYGIK
jgi:hypothetical protein